ncbi:MULTISPECIES: prepilin-type N-terminal cleavage/methylation domain-containing protein [Thermodesulfovibrio]|uniref:Prepilin-type N-terminal cleavage/methylation domain protein n=1 Tax=Thermodesulfovibrio yellowstonii (strain ATCC 51303 / DSM 11347 / YP87) TaxID=289376 RepID=B5YIP2_THEYD|nr:MULTISPECIES: prepilin-type N-terminal cleavage/methylation domain-containing protein [Thermodesulfovibrio]ACI21012.1 prepilin-type N-terminal cleavage/methylation domain protein [Thermodesulfovibrio yellowstonii DSM 11347]
MQVLKNQRGFTLIELAIVLVIIGIILGAVLKGKDLIENARAKKFVNDVRQFEILSWTFFDRKGYFPGADKNDPIIDGNPYDDIVNKGRFTDAPTTNAITIGSYTFYVWLGNDGQTQKRNIIAITNTTTTGGASFSDAELIYMEAFDTAVDGAVDAKSGRVRAAESATITSASWLVNGVTLYTTDNNWTSAAKALVYYFDRAP